MRLKSLLVAVTLLGFTVICVGLLVNADKAQKIDKLEVQSKTIDIKAHQLRGEQLQEKLELELQKGSKDQERLKQLEDENTKYQQETEQLKRDLQAKLDAKNKLAKLSATKKVYAATTLQNGSCADWMAQAGIASTTATNKLILKESGCRPNAVNPSSGACGIPQAYPCSKLPCPLNDSGAVCQLKWMSNYVQQRYGSWENALSFWYAQCNTKSGCWY